MKKILFPALLVLAVIFISGCGSSTSSELKSIVVRNLKAAQAEKIDDYLKDIDEGLAVTMRPVMLQIFKTYDLEYKLISFKLLSSTDTTAEVEVEQETKKISGPAFQNNRTTAVHTFTKRPSGWKFTATKLKAMKVI